MDAQPAVVVRGVNGASCAQPEAPGVLEGLPASWVGPKELGSLDEVREAARAYLKSSKEWVAYGERRGGHDMYCLGQCSVLRWLLGALGDRYKGDPQEDYAMKIITVETPSLPAEIRAPAEELP